MNIKPDYSVITITCLLFFAGFALAQEKAKKSVIIQTESKTLTTRLMLDKVNFIEVKGNAIFRLTEGNNDLSLAGVFSYNLSDEECQRIARALNKRLDEIPKTIVQKDVITQIQRETECPSLRLTFSAMDLPFIKKLLHFDRFFLVLKFPLETKETGQLATRIICTMARSNATGFPPDPAVRRLNRVLNGEEENK